jgi:GST-like protein
MYTLYDDVRTGGVFVRAVLAETGAAHEVVTIDHHKDEHLSEAYAAINPRRQIPALVLADASVLTEGVAIAMHLADNHAHAGLLPPVASAARAQVTRWLLFFATNVYEGQSRISRPARFVSDPACAPAVAAAAARANDEHYLIFEQALGDGAYLLGARASLADLYVWMLAQWHGDHDWLRARCPKVVRLVETVMARPRIAPLHEEKFGPGIGLS